MTLPYRRTLWTLIAVGTLARLGVAATTDGVAYDLASFTIVNNVLWDGDPLRFYAAVNESGDFGPFPRWPYPTGFLPVLLATAWVAENLGLALDHLIRVPFIVADGAIALLVADFLGRRGASERTRLAAAGLVALGPAFAAISGYHGQMDAVAILPAVLALSLWERMDGAERALVAGALIGLGGAIKTAPLLLLLALLPSVRSRREALTLLASAAAVPLIALLPFLLADPGSVLSALRYRGAPGLGGVSLLVQPELPTAWLADAEVRLNAATRALLDAGILVTLPVILGVAAFALRRRLAAPHAAVLLWLAFYVAGVNFFMQYLVWGLPFLLMCGYLRQVALLQVAFAPALVLTYSTSSATLVWLLYTPVVAAAWMAALVALVTLIARARAQPPPSSRHAHRSPAPWPGASAPTR